MGMNDEQINKQLEVVSNTPSIQTTREWHSSPSIGPNSSEWECYTKIDELKEEICYEKTATHGLSKRSRKYD